MNELVSVHNRIPLQNERDPSSMIAPDMNVISSTVDSSDCNDENIDCNVDSVTENKDCNVEGNNFNVEGIAISNATKSNAQMNVYNVDCTTESSDRNVNHAADRSEAIPPTNALPTTNPTSLSIILWNIRGIYDKLNEPDIQEYLFKHDIILITETHAYTTTDYDMPNHKYLNFARKYIHPNAPGPSGGIGLFISKNIIDGIKAYSSDESIVWLKLHGNFFGWNNDKLLAIVYFSPSDSTYVHTSPVNTDYFDILSTEIGKHMNDEVYICGDFNSRTGSIADYNENQNIPGSEGALDMFISDIPDYESPINVMTARCSKDKTVNEYGRHLLDFCKYSGYRIANGRLHEDKNVGEFTCITSQGSSLVDYLLCKPSDMTYITSFKIDPKRVISDHKPIVFSFICKNTEEDSLSAYQNTRSTPEKSPKTYKWDSRKLIDYVMNLYSPECLEMKEKFIEDAQNPYYDSNMLAESFYNYIHTAIDKTFRPRKNNTHTSKFPSNPWFNEECKTLKRAANDFAKNHDISIEPFKSQYQSLEKDYNRVTQKYKRQYKQSIRDKLEHNNSKNPTEYWKMWKKLNKTSKTPSNKLDIGDFENYFEKQSTPPETEYFNYTEMKEIEDLMKRYFNDQAVIPTECNDEEDLSHDFCNDEMSIDEIKSHLKKLKNNKAAGTDGLAGEFYKSVPDDLSRPISILFNSVFNNGQYPDMWAEGIINPVHKKGSENDTDNYRKITVMSAIGKLFESILNSRLVKRNIVLELDDECQFGFKNDRRTTDNIFILNAVIERQKCKGKPLYVCFVDFTKAFDYVNRSALYYKLVKRGVKGKLLNIICSMYEKATCRVKWKGSLSDKKINSQYGVLQGGMLSPHLFTEFLSDLGEYLDSRCGTVLSDKIIRYILFADDLILCSDTPDGLQSLLNGLYEFCQNWHLIVSLAKTNVLLFHHNKNIPTPSFSFGNENIEIVSDYKYLGTIVTTDHRNIFHKNFENLHLKANKAIFALNMYINDSVGYLQPCLSFKMFDCQILPILDYASDIWFNPTKANELEKIHLKYLKRTLKLKTSTVTVALYAETGRFPIQVKQKVQILKYWHRILTFPDTHILKQAYNSLYETHSIGKKNWCSIIHDILIEVEEENLWERQTILLHELESIKVKLYKSFMQNTLDKIHNSDLLPKLRTYKLFKNEFRLENYLLDLKDIRYQISLARFRTSSHRLRIETGRYDKPITPVENRKCRHCDLDALEDELHFLLVCPLYSTERRVLIDKCNEFFTDFDTLNNNDKFKLIMGNKDKEIISCVAQYIHQSFNIRNSQV